MKIEVGKKYPNGHGYVYEIVGKTVNFGSYDYFGIYRTSEGLIAAYGHFKEDGRSQFGGKHDLRPPIVKHTRCVYWLRTPTGKLWVHVSKEKLDQPMFGSTLLHTQEIAFEEIKE